MYYTFTEETLKTFIGEIKNNSIPVLSEDINIWNTPAGLYKVSSGSTIYYKGTTTNSPLPIDSDTYMIVTSPSETGSKGFFVLDYTSSGSRYLYNGYATTTSVGGATKFSIGVTYAQENRVLLKTNTTEFVPTDPYNPATKIYVDSSIQEAIGDALGGSY